MPRRTHVDRSQQQKRKIPGKPHRYDQAPINREPRQLIMGGDKFLPVQPAPDTAALTHTMAIALAETIDHGGKLVRHQGGYWTYPNCARNGDGELAWYINTTTLQALVRRGKVVYSEWRDGRFGLFPIAAEVSRLAVE